MLRDTAVPALEVYLSKFADISAAADDIPVPEKKPLEKKPVLNLARAVYPDFVNSANVPSPCPSGIFLHQSY